MDKDAAWSISPDVRATYSEDGAFLLDTKDEFYYRLDKPGAQIWITIETSPSGIAFDDILDVLETHFDVSRNKLAVDLCVHLQRLHVLGFIETYRET